MHFKIEILSYTLISSLEIIFFSVYFSFLGASFYSFFYKEKIKINDFLKLNIIGIFALYIFTSIWNIFLPINKYTFLITLIPIVSFVSKNFWKFITQLKSILNRQSFFFVISIFLTLIWVSNIGIGSEAGRYNATGGGNVYIGVASGKGVSGNNNSRNTGVGFNALEGITTGNDNTGLGYQSLTAVTTGSYNVAIGKGALDAGTTLTNNVAVGNDALGSNTTGNYNTAVGQSCLL